ncbi:methyltransferase domain-containing protein [Paracoccus aminovorans]|uniref:methyltransferase domain-containing protein n=1 Tax=Paracoccus aminovorans TaxID=34004 RepID=UPI003CC7A567
MALDDPDGAGVSASRFTGYDFHPASITAATAHARAHGGANVRFEVGRAQDFDGDGCDLITCLSIACKTWATPGPRRPISSGP